MCVCVWFVLNAKQRKVQRAKYKRAKHGRWQRRVGQFGACRWLHAQPAVGSMHRSHYTRNNHGLLGYWSERLSPYVSYQAEFTTFCADLRTFA